MGAVVLCSGNSPGGFVAGAGVNGLAVTIQNGATVGTGITVNDNNTLINSGNVTVGPSATAILLGNTNTVTNFGTIVAGDDGTGISITGAGSIVNSGIVTIGNGSSIGLSAPNITNTGAVTVGDLGIGLNGTADFGTLFNSGRIAVGDDGMGIQSSFDFQTITNTGSITFGGCGWGIFAVGTGNTIVNSGSLTKVDCGGGGGGTGIQAGDSNNVTNSGTIVVGDLGTGISGGLGTTILNSGRIVVGDDGVGILSGGNITNSGTIIVGSSFSALTGGMVGLGNGLRLTNTGTIIGGFQTPAMIVTGDNGFLFNSGSISVGEAGGGLISLGDGATITNTGTIVAGPSGIGLQSQGANAVLVNSGTISVGDCGAGIDTSLGSGSTVTNSGRIMGTGCAATGVALGTNDTLTNSGQISAPFSITSQGTVAVTNSGTLDGALSIAGPSSSLTNSGLITITAPWTGTGVQHTIDGSFTQSSAGTLALRVSPSASAYDSLSVTGVANLGGTLRAVVLPGLYGSTTTYSQVVGFGSLTGAFSSVTSSSPFLTAAAVYTGTGTDLVLTRIPFNQVSTGGANARALGNILESNYSTSLTGALATAYANLFASTAPNTLSQLTGEVSSAGQSAAFAGFSQFLGSVFSQTGTVRSGNQALAGRGAQSAAARNYTAGGGTRVAMADSCDADGCGATDFRRVTAWAQGFGAAGSVDRDNTQGSSRLDVNTAGSAFGVDVQLTSDFVLGVTMGRSSTSYALTDLASSGSNQTMLFGLYSGYTAGPAYLDAALAYGYGSFTTTRFVSTGGFDERIDGAYNGSQIGGRLEGGWRFAVDRHTLTPFAGITVQMLHQSGYTESSQALGTGGSGVLALTVQPQTTTSVRSVFGGQLESVFRLDETLSVTPRFRLGWAHEFNTTRSTTATLSSLLPGSPFTTTGASPPSDSAIVSAGIDIDIGAMTRLYAQFDGDFASTARYYSGTGGIRLFW